MIRKYQSFLERVEPTGRKRMLTIDGGGIRGLISIEILARLEALLREAYDDPELVLGDYFDYVGGTSTGAIIAAGISFGMTMDRIRTFYREGSKVMLKPAPYFTRWFYHRLSAVGLTKKLKEVLGDTRLGEPGLPHPPAAKRKHAPEPLKTLLMLVMYRVDTDSPWPLSNNPKAKYNGGPEAEGNNMFVPLWQLVRASTAAPTFFPPERIGIGDQACVFVDGAVTPYNNPSYLLYTMATLKPYNLNWEKDEDKLLLVSIGTGSIPKANPKLKARQMTMLYSARSIPSALIYANTVEADKLCRIAGRCHFGEKIDSELGELRVLPGEPPLSPPKDFTYVRYDPNLTEAGLTELGLFPRIKPEYVLPLISGKHVEALGEVGRAYAQNVNLAHFGAFDPARGLF